MKHPIGFCVQGSAPEAVPAPAAPAETAAVPSVVRVFFPERGQAYSYYNDRFDLHDGDLVYVSGKLARQRGQVVAVDYNFRIRLADYERVIGAADRNVRGTFYALGAHLVTLEPNVLPFRQVRGWFLPPEADGEYAVGHGPGPVYALEQLSIPAGVAEKGHTYYMENRVIYLSVDGTTGRAIVSGTVPYEITFTYADGSVSALTCTCYETGLCKHGAAVLLQLRETLEKIHEHWPDALAEDGYFAAVSKSAFSFFHDKQQQTREHHAHITQARGRTMCSPGRVVCYLPAAADVWPYTRVCTSVSIARSSEGVRAPPVVSRYSGIGLPPGASAG